MQTTGRAELADGNDPLLELSRRQSMNWRTFVVPEARVMFVQVNKNACTSLKWMMAGIAGEDFDAFGPGVEASTNRFDDIHDRNQWTKTPRLGSLDPALRHEIHPDHGWFVFGVTRDPRSRMFSAWQSKLLLDNPGYRQLRDRWWYPRHPVSTETITEDFATFADYVLTRPLVGIRRDGHFRDQVDMLHEDLVTYSDIYDIRDMGRLTSDLRKHLDGVGWAGELFLPRVNDTPVRANAAVFADGVREKVEQIYAADFARFAGRWDFAAIEAIPEWTHQQLVEIEQVAEHGMRVGQLMDEVSSLKSEAVTLKSEAGELRTDLEAERAKVDDLRHKLRAAKAPVPLRRQLRTDARRVGAALRRRLPSA